jgi:hypothetical protein
MRQATTTPRLATTLAALMAAQGALGLRYPDQYRDADWIRATWFGNDWVTLLVGAPLLLIGAATARRSRRGFLLLVGTLAFALYNDAFYLFGAALNVFFPIYVAVFVLSAGALIAAVSGADADDLAAASKSARTRLVGGYFVLVGLGLAAVWIGMWAAYVFFGRPTPVAPDAFALVAALDLSIMVPGLVVGGALLWWEAPLGSLIAPMAGILASLYLLVLAVNSIVFIERGLSTAPGELPLWGALFAATTAATASIVFAIDTLSERPRYASLGAARR